MAMRLSKTAARSLALLLSLALCAIAAEIVLRYRCTVCTWMEQNTGEYVSPYREPFHNWWYHLRAPNEVSSYQQPEFDYELSTNSLGIRDVEHPLEKPSGEFRIVGLGDSFTEGQGVPYEDSYLKVLERSLNQRPARVKVRVIVGGVAGSDPFYCYKLLEDKLLPFQPDLVTLTINNSDITDIITRGGNERFLPDGRVRVAEPPGDEWLFARSHLYRVFLMLVLGYDWFGLSPEDHVAKRTDAVEKLKGIADQFQELGRKKSFRLVVILHPDLYELVTATYAFDAEALKRHFSANGIASFDVMEHFLKKVGPEPKDRESLYWKRDFHYNREGYRLFAEGLEEYLTANGYIEPARADSTR
jgi:lysophospholipase L1-like esterase